MTDLYRKFGPVALVTGASDGIGRAFARKLAAEGFDLVLVARREAVLGELASELEGAHGIAATVLAMDLTEAGAVDRLMDEVADLRIGLLVAAAGYGSLGPFLDLPVENELRMIGLNCAVPVALVAALAPRMQSQGGGGIVLFGSLVGFQGAPLAATYAATKNFIQAFAEGLREDLRLSGIQVLSVAPGPVASGFGARAAMRMSMTDTPDAVAAGALAAIATGGTVRPGRLGKLLGWSLSLAPRSIRVRIMGRIMRSMSAHADGRHE